MPCRLSRGERVPDVGEGPGPDLAQAVQDGGAFRRRRFAAQIAALLDKAVANVGQAAQFVACGTSDGQRSLVSIESRLIEMLHGSMVQPNTY